MGMSRTDAVRYLAAQYGPLEEVTDTSPSDSTSGYKHVITDALLTLPTSYADAIDTAYEVEEKTLAYRTLLRFYALTNFKQKLTTDESYSIDSGGVNTKRSVAFAQVNVMLEDVIEQLAGLGYSVGTTSTGAPRGIKVRDLFGDYIEPNIDSEI